MVIVYYRNQEGKIIRHHDMRNANYDVWTLAKMAKNYNENESTRDTAHVIEVPEDSVTAYLFKKVEDKTHARKETIHQILDSLDSVRDFIYDLE